jgi:hypothetical protein
MPKGIQEVIMANFDNLKDKAKDTIDSVADFTQDTAKKAETTAKAIALRIKLTTKITQERTIIRRNHIDIGKKYYDLHKDSPDESLKVNCDLITKSLENIKDMEAQLEDLGK